MGPPPPCNTKKYFIILLSTFFCRYAQVRLVTTQKLRLVLFLKLKWFYANILKNIYNNLIKNFKVFIGILKHSSLPPGLGVPYFKKVAFAQCPPPPLMGSSNELMDKLRIGALCGLDNQSASQAAHIYKLLFHLKLNCLMLSLIFRTNQNGDGACHEAVGREHVGRKIMRLALKHK